MFFLFLGLVLIGASFVLVIGVFCWMAIYFLLFCLSSIAYFFQWLFTKS